MRMCVARRLERIPDDGFEDPLLRGSVRERFAEAHVEFPRLCGQICGRRRLRKIEGNEREMILLV